MHAPAPAPPTIPEYGLAAPTHESIVDALARHVGDAEAARLWMAACAAVGVDRDDVAPDQLRRAARRLAAVPGVAGVCGHAIAVRLTTYVLLHR
jgi:hypothetical protein